MSAPATPAESLAAWYAAQGHDAATAARLGRDAGRALALLVEMAREQVEEESQHEGAQPATSPAA